MVHSRYEFSSNRRAMPLFGMDGSVDWVVYMLYNCNDSTCSIANISAIDARLLASIPLGMRRCYPVDPRYAQSSSFHLSNSLTQWLRATTITYLSADMFARTLLEMISSRYIQSVEEYVELCRHGNVAIEPYPSLNDWMGRYPPNGSTLRDLLSGAETSALNSTGVSDYDRHRRELQSVKSETCFSFDHCAATAKCFKSRGIKYTFNVTNEVGEVMSCLAVGSTKTAEYAHAMEQLVRRRGFDPKAYYSDIFPSGSAFWELLLGKEVSGRLGLFHFVQRIVRTLRDNHELFYQAIQELKKCLYQYVPSDFSVPLLFTN